MSIVEWYGFCVRSDNLPLHRPGAYRFTNLVNGKPYIGISKDVFHRGVLHANSAIPKAGRIEKGVTYFVRALRKYGTSCFLFEPLAYGIKWFDDWHHEGGWLRQLEADLIIDYDAIAKGYNILANWHGGQVGEKFRKIMLATFTPERRAVQSEATRAYLTEHPDQAGRYFREWRQSLSLEEKADFVATREPARRAGIDAFYNDPEKLAAFNAKCQTPTAIAKRAANIRETWADPELRAEQSARLKKYLSVPEHLAVRRAQFAETQVLATAAAQQKIGGGYWAYKGNEEQRFSIGDVLPEGWIKGRLRQWITDSKVNKQLARGEQVPEGWHLGRILRRRKRKRVILGA